MSDPEDLYDSDSDVDDTYDQNGFDLDGYDRDGYDGYGYNDSGYDRQGYDATGTDREGYDEDGYNEDGYNRSGFDMGGFTKEGVHAKYKVSACLISGEHMYSPPQFVRNVKNVDLSFVKKLTMEHNQPRLFYYTGPSYSVIHKSALIMCRNNKAETLLNFTALPVEIQDRIVSFFDSSTMKIAEHIPELELFTQRWKKTKQHSRTLKYFNVHRLDIGPLVF